MWCLEAYRAHEALLGWHSLCILYCMEQAVIESQKWLGLEGASNITQLLHNADNMQVISKEPLVHTGRGKTSFVLI